MKIVYTLSHRGHMTEDLKRSLSTLTPYICPKDIIIFLTEPIVLEELLFLTRRGYDVRIRHKTEWKFASKNYLCDIQDDDVIFLDCDTVAKKDPALLLGDFVFSARPGTSNKRFNYHWKDTLEKYGLHTVPMFNSGVVVFRQGIHRVMAKTWKSFLDMYIDRTLVPPHKDRTMLNQYALSLAVAAHVPPSGIKYMTHTEHGYNWMRESTDTIIYHLKRMGGSSR